MKHFSLVFWLRAVVLVLFFQLAAQSVQAQCQPLAAGTYTVGGTQADYSSLEAALQALQCGGVQGPVVLQLQAGTYAGAYVLPALPGNLQMVTLRGAAGVRFERPVNALQSECVLINGGRWQLEQLHFDRPQRMRNPGPLVKINGGSGHRLRANRFTDQTPDRRAANQALWAAAADSLQLDSNRFEGFSRAVVVHGPAVSNDLRIHGNHWQGYKGPALLVQQQFRPHITGNHFENAQGTDSLFAAVHLAQFEGLELHGNHFTGRISPTALYLNHAIANAGFENRVYNNEINGTTDTLDRANLVRIRTLWLQGEGNAAELLVLAHNTIRLRVQGNSSQLAQALLFVSGFSGGVDSLGVFNNLFSAEAAPGSNLPASLRAIRTSQAPLAGCLFDHNLYWMGGTTQPIFQRSAPSASDYSSLAAWRSVSGGDAASRLQDPWFASALSSLPANDSVGGLGFAVLWVGQDLAGNFRNMPPDAGAFEFDLRPSDLQIQSILSPAASICSYSNQEVLRVQVRNLGQASAQQVKLTAALDGVPFLSETFSLSLAPGAAAICQFTDSLPLAQLRPMQLRVYIDSLPDAFPANDSLQLNITPLSLQAYPFLEDFEDEVVGVQSTQQGWRVVEQQHATWRVHSGPSPQAQTGPATDARGSVTGKYLLMERDGSGMGAGATFEIPCIDLSALSSPVFSYSYHGCGPNLYFLYLDQKVQGQWVEVDSIWGQQQSGPTDPWLLRRVFLDPLATDLRFRGAIQSGVYDNWALDDLRFGEILGEELVLDSAKFDLDACDSTGNLTATLYLRNDGTTVLGAVQAGWQLNNGSPVYALSNRALVPFGTDTIQMSIPLAGLQSQQVRVFAANPGDVSTINDTLEFTLQRSGQIDAYPYLATFEAADGWQGGGRNSSWERGQPTGVQINQAYQANAAWVTAPSGLPNDGERSWLLSPCFDFSQLIRPQLRFALQHALGDRMAAQMQYSLDGGDTWQVLGSLFSGQAWYSRPNPVGLLDTGGFWSGSSNGWQLARHDLSFLAGEPSVQFRYLFVNDFDLSGAPSVLEGLAIDAFEIFETPGAFAFQTTPSPGECAPVPHQITTRVAPVSNLQTVELRFSVNRGSEQAGAMSLLSNGTYQATIPPLNAGDLVQWRIVTVADTTLSTPIYDYIDGFLQTALADVAAPERSQHAFEAGLASNGALGIGLAGSDTAGGVWFKVEAKRQLQISGIELQVQQFTALELYLMGEDTVINQLNPLRSRLLGTARGNSTVGFSLLSFDEPLQLGAGQSAILYLRGLNENDFRVELPNVITATEDANLRVWPGRLSTRAFESTSTLAWPIARLIVQNPADSVRWLNAAGQFLNDGPQHQRIMGSSPDEVILQIFQGSCVFSDTALFTPTGQVDLGVEALLSPDLDQVQPGVFYPVTVVVRNHGNLSYNQFNMAYRVNGVELGNSTVARSIAPGDTLHYTFPQAWTWVETGAIVFCAYPKNLDLDVQTANDTTCQARFPTSVEELGGARLRLYPNPASAGIWLESEEGWANATFRLSDLSGRAMLEMPLQLAPGERFYLPLPPVSDGLYLYQLENSRAQQQGRLLLQSR